MVDIKENRLFFLYVVLILYSTAFLINFFGENFSQVHYGKDGGLIFRVITTCIVSSLFFYVFKSMRINWLFIGLLIGLCSYVLTFLIYVITSMIAKGDNSGWDIPLIFDQFIATTIIFIAGVFFTRTNIKKG